MFLNCCGHLSEWNLSGKDRQTTSPLPHSRGTLSPSGCPAARRRGLRLSRKSFAGVRAWCCGGTGQDVCLIRTRDQCQVAGFVGKRKKTLRGICRSFEKHKLEATVLVHISSIPLCSCMKTQITAPTSVYLVAALRWRRSDHQPYANVVSTDSCRTFHACQLRKARRKAGRGRRWGGVSRRRSGSFSSYQPGERLYGASAEVGNVTYFCVLLFFSSTVHRYGLKIDHSFSII